jgi:hypothetical protein
MSITPKSEEKTKEIKIIDTKLLKDLNMKLAASARKLPIFNISIS